MFRTSKRYPTFLRYVVEHTLDADPTQLKERTLGVEVFGRDPDYDTTLDPVVRTTAGELRKRIAQYYYEAGHENEIRFDLPSGSYVPEFRLPAQPEAPTIAAQPMLVPVVPVRQPWREHLIWMLVAAVLLAIACTALWLRPWATKTALDRFWAPIHESSSTVLLCIGGPGDGHYPANPKRLDATVSVHDIQQAEHVALADAMTLSRFTGILQSKGKQYHIRGERSTTLTDLREGPVVLIGAFNNEWTLRLMRPLRFSFERSPDTVRIKDQQNLSNNEWAINVTSPYLNLTEDYAIVSRVWDPTTQQFVVVAAGLAKYGTVAAGEFLTNPAYMEEAASHLQENWYRKNLELVLGTKVIDGNSGPPRVLATYSW